MEIKFDFYDMILNYYNIKTDGLMVTPAKNRQHNRLYDELTLTRIGRRVNVHRPFGGYLI